MFLVMALLAAQAQVTAGAETPVRPATSPATWMNQDDYPVDQEREGHQGTFGFVLRVNTAGRPVECKVTESTGYGELDGKSCSLLLRRARFEPARDSHGKPIESEYSSKFRWMIGGSTVAVANAAKASKPAPGELNLTVAALPAGYRQQGRMEIDFDQDGRLNRCLVKESTGSAAADRAACGQLGRLAPRPKADQTQAADAVIEYIVSFRTDAPAKP